MHIFALKSQYGSTYRKKNQNYEKMNILFNSIREILCRNNSLNLNFTNYYYKKC